MLNTQNAIEDSLMSSTSLKQVYIETYGCQMNEYDTELIKSILKKESYEFVSSELDADIVMLNTCSVRENANNKVYNRIHDIRNARKGKPVLVGVLGCMATNFRKKLLDNPSLKIDFIAGPDSYKSLPSLIQAVSTTGEKSFDVTLSEFETYSDILPSRKEGVNAWIAVMRGCNNYCTFCVVPHTRGRERSRDPFNVAEEVKQLVKNGYKQVTLLGQNVNSYQYEQYDFADLLQIVSEVDGLERIRYTSPHPKDFPLKLLNLMATNKKICNQIHMPLQAGNSRVLDKMNRTYTKEEFLYLAQQIKDTIPGVTMTTDIIVGFPTETYEEFKETMEVVEKVRFDSAFIFKYSERPNTLASKRFPDDVTEEEKTKRIVELIDLQRAISLEKNQAEIGQIQEILIDQTTTKKSDDNIQGRNDGNKIVILPKGNYKIGDIIQAKIVSATTNALRGEYI